MAWPRCGGTLYRGLRLGGGARLWPRLGRYENELCQLVKLFLNEACLLRIAVLKLSKLLAELR
jgi:hypothetical protein